MTQQFRVAVVGTGGQAERVAVPTVRLHPDVVLVGVAGSGPGRANELGGKLGVPAFDSVADLLASPVDAVWVTAPNHLHVPLAQQCLGEGIHVLLEKPMATGTESAEELMVTALGSSAVMRVAFQHRFRDAHRELREVLASGALGEIGHLRLHRNWLFPYFPGQRTDDLSRWRGSRSTSGGWAINDIGSHLVDLMLWLTGEPLELLAAHFTKRFTGIDNDSSAFLTLRMGEAGLVTIETSNVLASPGSLLEAYGRNGWLRSIDSFHESCRTESSLFAPRSSATSSQEAYSRMFEDFVSACAGNHSIGATAEQALAGVQIVERAITYGCFLEDLSSR
jgi:UDP-N-acetylglucosamine 3-dehydrogenase